jgi:hypothetical protein
MFNRPEDLVDAIFKAAASQGVTIYHPATKQQLT